LEDEALRRERLSKRYLKGKKRRLGKRERRPKIYGLKHLEEEIISLGKDYNL